MGRAAMRIHAVRFVVFVVACMMVASVTGTGGFVLLQDDAGKSLRIATSFQISHGHDAEAAEEEADSHGSGSVLLGMEVLGDSFTPEFLPPPDEGKISPMSVQIHCSTFLPRIYRPPIS